VPRVIESAAFQIRFVNLAFMRSSGKDDRANENVQKRTRETVENP